MQVTHLGILKQYTSVIGEVKLVCYESINSDELSDQALAFKPRSRAVEHTVGCKVFAPMSGIPKFS
jgi:hypothetical protein